MDWQRLSDAVISRRIELGYGTRQAFARATGITSRTIGDIEKYRKASYGQSTLAQIEQTLRWAPGSIRAVLAGGDPTPVAGLGGRSHQLAVEVDMLLRDDSRLTEKERQRLAIVVDAAIAPYRSRTDPPTRG